MMIGIVQHAWNIFGILEDVLLLLYMAQSV